MRILSPSVRQSASLFVQGLRKVSVQSLAALFCLSVSFATSPPPVPCHPLLPACLLSWHGRVRALQAARSFSCILLGCHKMRWAPFNPISEIHSDVRKRGEKGERNHIFISPPVRHLPISLEVREWHQLMTVGRRRHQHWHKRSMFQASGGIMRGLLLCRR